MSVKVKTSLSESDKTKISWTDSTWNPVTGCDKISEGCRNCYAEVMSKNLQETGSKRYANGFSVTCHENVLAMPLKMKEPKKIFVNSMSDLFHKGVPFEFVDKIFAVMAMSPRHTFQILTRRPERMLEYLATEPVGRLAMIKKSNPPKTKSSYYNQTLALNRAELPLPNVWLGISVENQEMATYRIPILLKTPAAVRWVSFEPLLGPVDLTDGVVDAYTYPNRSPLRGDWIDFIDWAVIGGESGPNARIMEAEWAIPLLNQFKNRYKPKPVFFKQWGGKGRDKGGSMLPGMEVCKEFPSGIE
jgi:protein gp37